MFYGTNKISQDIPHIQTKCGKYLGISHKILSVSQNIVMDLNNILFQQLQHV